MKKHLLALLFLCSSLNAQSVGDLIIQQVTATGADELYVTPTATRLFGIDSSGNPTTVSLANGLSMPSNVLTIGTKDNWLLTLPIPDEDTISTEQVGMGWADGRFTLQTPVGAFQLYETGSPLEPTLYWPGRLQIDTIEANLVTANFTGNQITSGTIPTIVMLTSTTKPMRQWQDSSSYAGANGLTYGNTGPAGVNEPSTPGRYFPVIDVVDDNSTGNYLDGEIRTGTQLKTDLSLDAVENTPLSTWSGTGNIDTVGTITVGTWAADAIADGYISSATTWNAKEPPITAGTTAQYWRGDKSWQTLNSSSVGLGNVENTALSTWAGSSSITTLGTVGTGVWQGTAIGDTYISSAATWTAKQDGSAQLTSLSGLSYAGNAGKFIRVNAGETAFELATVSGSGTVTSVALSAPTGFAVTGSPITTTGTLALSYDAGYQGYTTSEASKLAGIEAGADVTDATNVAAAGAVMVGGALGTPSSGTMTNVSGTAASLTAGNATAAEGLKSATTTVVVSGATAPTSGQVLTATSSTAASWQTPSGGAGSTVYTIMAQHGQTPTWADAATYYFGSQYGRTSTITSGGKCSIPIVRTGTITKIALRTYSLTAGSSESWEFFIRVNDTTDTSLGTVATSANARDWNATVSIAVTAGDFIEFKTVCPTWATNPVNNSLIATIYIEE